MMPVLKNILEFLIESQQQVDLDGATPLFGGQYRRIYTGIELVIHMTIRVVPRRCSLRPFTFRDDGFFIYILIKEEERL